MGNMGVDALPHAVNALLLTSIYSASDCYMFTAIRSLYALAQGGHAPKILLKTMKNGVPIYCFAVSIGFSCLAYLKLSSSTVTVLNRFINLATGGQLVTYIACCVNYLFFYRALKAQNYNRKDLPYCGCFQPYGTWIALIWLGLIEIFWGYAVFLPGSWDVGTFFSKYGMILLSIATFSGWKLFKSTSFVNPYEADLIWARPAVDLHERLMAEIPVHGFRRSLMEVFSARFGEKTPAVGSMA
ncbi:General amino acid permease AGP2 [Colletotrichum aenigma]|uniref:General amino acid permease AGP2 n=1 Tax=Colletotrichum aenigma TaxID=1215731 RepID=UPI001873376B|nr:General amino acid permease AGP2 [Colletotrichum aenigma]KAF5519581.1 General amino acid permease AGP2 [Colletotrichum aenigma]